MRAGMHLDRGFSSSYSKLKSNQWKYSVHPFGQIVTALQCSTHFSRIHACILGKVLRILPLEKLHTIFRVRCSTEVTVCRSLLVLRLAQGQGCRDRTWTCVELDLQDIRNIVSGNT